MKTILVAIAMMIACQNTFAQQVNELFDTFKSEQGADYMQISPLMMKIACLFMRNDNAESRFVKGIKSAKVLDLEDCTEKVKEDFKKEANLLNLKGYETLFIAREDGETVKILAKSDEKNIRELLIFTIDKVDCGAILMKGKIKKDDIAVMINEDKVMINGRK